MFILAFGCKQSSKRLRLKYFVEVALISSFVLIAFFASIWSIQFFGLYVFYRVRGEC